MINEHNRSNVEKRARAMIADQVYCNRWFGAVSFFHETFRTKVIKQYKRYFFITRDEMFTGNGIYAVREITDKTIDTVAGPLDSEQACHNYLNHIPNFVGTNIDTEA